MKVLLLLVVALVSGCASNPFKTYYNQAATYEQITGSELSGKSNPAILMRDDPDQDSLALVHSGHLPLGFSKFVGTNPSAAKAKAFGSELGADLVVLYSEYRNTETRSADIPMPASATVISSGGWATAYGTENQTFSYNVDKHEFMAGYWVKAKPKRWGVFVKDLTPSQFAELNTNFGALIRVTVKGSPAHLSGLRRGDVVTRFDGARVSDGRAFMDMLDRVPANGSAKLEIVRGGMVETITLSESGS